MSFELELVSLKQLRHGSILDDSDFTIAYGEFIVGRELEREKLVYLLSRAVLFLRSDDQNLNKLGYRIVLHYSLSTGDYEPLYEVAAAKDYAPILEVIESLDPAIVDRGFSNILLSANRVNFVVGEGISRSIRTRGQLELREFAHKASFSVVVAPTSYGKSEMMRERIHDRLDKFTAIMVPTKSLIAQTRANLVRDPILVDSSVRVITHPESFVLGSPFVAVMTQERIFRLFRDNPELQLSQLLVDEAHNILTGDRRATQASEVVLTALHRNPSLELVYYTPFMTNPESLVHVNSARVLDHSESTEHVKVERYYYTLLETGELYLYDQFLKCSFKMPGVELTSETQAVRKLAGRKNLVYLNRPKKAEEIANKLAALGEVRVDNVLDIALKAIADYVHPEYKLIECLRRGVAFHHGGMPDLIRIYVEDLFAHDSPSAPSLLVSTSTLLEGVNTPADTLFIMNPRKGPKNLSPSQFRNLAGRVGRFKEIFSPVEPQLNLLEPRVFIFDGVSAGSRFNPERFLHRVADVGVDASAPAENVLLENAEDHEHRHELLERLENLEPGVSRLADMRLLTTPAGMGALSQGVDDYDLFENEEILQNRVEEWRTTQGPIDTCTQLIFAIWRIFLEDLPIDEKKSANIARLASSSKARDFYAMFLDWRAQGMSLREMVSREISYFKKQKDALVFVGTSWGDTTLGEGWRKLWMRPSEKSSSELATLAVAKIKEEQDFVDFYLMKYVETLRELGLVVDSIYHRIKYGTDDSGLILCIQNGLSLELAKLILSRYPSFVRLDHAEGVLKVDPRIVDQMFASSENEILIFEASRLS